MEIDRLLQKQQLNVQKSALVCPAKSTRPRLKSLLWAEVSGPDFTWQCAKKAFSPVNDQAAWAQTDFFNRIGQKRSFKLQSLLRRNGFARTKDQATRRH